MKTTLAVTPAQAGAQFPAARLGPGRSLPRTPIRGRDDKISRIIVAIIASFLLAACATQKSYRDGQTLVAQGKTEEGLQKLQEALRADPRNAEFRAAFLQARDRLTFDLVGEAQRAEDAERTDDALRIYQRVLAFDANNERARAGITSIERNRRHDAQIKEAEAAFKKGDVEPAVQRLRQILSENPNHVAARALQRTIAESAVRPGVPAQLAEAMRKPVTIEFRDTPLRQVFEVLSRTSGLNFVFDRDVRPDLRTTVFLRNSTVEAAVNMLLLTNSLEQRVIDATTVVIYPNTPAKTREYQQLVVKSFLLASADAKVVANSIRTLVRTRDVIIDERLNMVIVRDSPEAVRLAERIVLMHDAPEPEVMLEVEILEVKRSRLLELGVRWPAQLSLSPLPGTTGGTLTLDDLRNLNQRRIGATIDPLTINARKQDSDTNLLANPRIRVRNREKAKVLIGDRLPTITSTSTATGFISESVNYIDVGLKLDVEPTIYPDGEVAIRIALEVSNVVAQIQTRSGTVAFQLGTRSAATTLRLKDGENQVLAGLIQDDERSAGNRVPGLGDIPVLGRLFGSQLDDNAKTEIVLSITPRLIRNIQRPDASLSEFEAGTEASVRSRGGEAGVSPLPGPQPPPVRPSPISPGAPTSPTSPTPLSPPVTGVTTTPGGSPIVGGAPATGAVTGTAQMVFQGQNAVKVGDTFALQLFMQADAPVISVPLTIGFDPKVLAVAGVAEGEFMRQGGATSTFSSRVDPVGRVLVTATRAGGTGVGSLAPLLTINLRATAVADDTRVQVLSISPVGADGRAISATPPPPHSVRVTQ